ncbi:MAG: recombinase zinc beta ribbon domain-containing protein, partial [Cohaesibacteraceae bacterium]|nr:recombinase zinc beta ribbon domain-containing protein [Cohaesibacteraceae bacterium]
KGGKKPAVSTLYKMLSNPFYAGFILWNGQIYEGKHKPVVSKQEFEQTQVLISGETKIKPKKHAFAYAGLLRCGACGLSVTAEYKRKPSGREYTYYHCTRVHRTPKCTQPSIEVRQLESQIVEFMKQLSIVEPVFDWLAKQLSQFNGELKSEEEAIAEKHALAVNDYEKQISNLTDLRLRDVITDDEFTNKRKNLQISIASARGKAEIARKEKPTFEPLKILSMFNARAVKYFSAADVCMKRKLLKILCSNPTLKDKKVRLEARFPFIEMLSAVGVPRLCGKVENVRTKPHKAKKLTKPQVQKLAIIANDPKVVELAFEAVKIMREVEPQTLHSLPEDQDYLLQSHTGTDTGSITDCQ